MEKYSKNSFIRYEKASVIEISLKIQLFSISLNYKVTLFVTEAEQYTGQLKDLKG